MLGLAIQAGGETHGTSGLLAPALFILGSVVVGGLFVWLTAQVVARLRGWRMRSARLHAEAGAERRARVVMGELCPHGWRAELILDSGPGVMLDWHELVPGGQPGPVRRVRADSVAQALEAMVAERRTDLTLEQIELQASADGLHWPEP